MWIGYIIPKKAPTVLDTSLPQQLMTMKPKKAKHFNMIFCKNLATTISGVHVPVTFSAKMSTILRVVSEKRDSVVS